MTKQVTFSAFLAGSFLATAFFGGLRAGEVISDPGFALDNGDTNGDLDRDLRDAVYLVGHLFLGGPGPVELHPALQNRRSSGTATRMETAPGT